MLMIILVFLFFCVLALIVMRRRAIGRLSSLAMLLAGLIAMVWMQDHGLLPDRQAVAPPEPAAVPAR